MKCFFFKNKNPLNLCLLFILLSLIFLSGCVNSSIYVKVNPDGTIPDYIVVIETSSEYKTNILEKLNEMDNRDDWIMDVKNQGSKVIITLKGKKTIIINDEDKMSFESTNGKITFRDFSLSDYSDSDYSVKDDYYQSDYYSSSNNYQTSDDSSYLLNYGVNSHSVQVHYYLKMPGKIINTNADKFFEDKAIWDINGNPQEIWAICESPLLPIPGFNAIISIIGLSIAIIFLSYHETRRSFIKNK